jgi:hypothetical protein
MHWAVECRLTGDDQYLVVNALAALGATVEIHDQKTHLRAAEFDALNCPDAVRERAIEVIDAVATAVLRYPVEFSIGSAILRVAPDGAIVKHAFTQVIASAGGFLSMTGGIPTITIAPSPHLSADEQHLARERQLQSERDARSKIAITQAVAAFKSGHVKRALRLLAQVPFDERAMYGIKESIDKDGQSNWAKLGLVPEAKRFSDSINHPEVFGEKSRHAVPDRGAPANPMSPAAADTFIRAAAERWIKLVAERP